MRVLKDDMLTKGTLAWVLSRLHLSLLLTFFRSLSREVEGSPVTDKMKPFLSCVTSFSHLLNADWLIPISEAVNQISSCQGLAG